MYSLWYIQRPPWDSGVTPPELLEFLKTLLPGRAIDLGCGTGTNAITLAEQGWIVTGIDFVPAAIQKARKKVQQAGVKVDLSINDVTRLDGIQGPFDFALDLGCFHSLSMDERAAYLRQLERILVPGGSWFVYGFVLSEKDGSAPGLCPEDLQKIESIFRLRSRKDGYNRGSKPSAYFIFEKLDTGK